MATQSPATEFELHDGAVRAGSLLCCAERGAWRPQVRLDTYGAEGDLGQSSWMSVAELDRMMAKLGVTATSNVLEVCACRGQRRATLCDPPPASLAMSPCAGVALPPQLARWRGQVGSGAGGTSVYVAQKYGCAITGVDLNPHGVATGTKMAEMEGVADKASFKVIDASKPLPYAEGSFDAVFCNDSMCHIPGRQVTRVIIITRTAHSKALILRGTG